MLSPDLPEAEGLRLTRLLAGARYLETALSKQSLNRPSIPDSLVNSLASGVGKAIRRDPVAEARFLKAQR